MTATKNNIITLPNASLRTKSQRIGIVTDAVRTLVDNMQSATLDWEDNREHELAVALAAVQIDELYRVVIIRSNFEDKTDRSFHVFINPEITKYEGEIEEDYEGCLSVRDVYGRVPRHTKVRIKALNLQGKAVNIKAEGFLARVFQHEIDHTHGKLFVDIIKDKPDAFYQLQADGKLAPLDYEKNIKDSRILW